MKRVLTLLSFFLLVIANVSYLLAIVMERIKNAGVILLMTAFLVLLFYAYLKTPAGRLQWKSENAFEHPSSIFFTAIGAALTYYLSINLQFGPVTASAAVGMLGWFIPFLKRKSNLLKYSPAPVYCGSFVGMCSADVVCSTGFIVLAGILAGLIFFLSKPVLKGVGGKLGTIAFAGVAVTLCIHLVYI